MFFKRNIEEVLIFVHKKFLKAGLISSVITHQLSWATGVVFFATILATFKYSAMNLLSRYLL